MYQIHCISYIEDLKKKNSDLFIFCSRTFLSAHLITFHLIICHLLLVQLMMQAMEPPKTSLEPIQQPSLPSRNEFIQNGFSDFATSATSGSTKVSRAELNDGRPSQSERPMSVLNVEYITPARPIWMSHNRCFHVFRSITDLSGRSSSRDGRCRCQPNCRRLWFRLTCQIGPQCLSQKPRQNSTPQTA